MWVKKQQLEPDMEQLTGTKLRKESHGFSRVAAGTWGIFSSYDGDAHSKREFV